MNETKGPLMGVRACGVEGSAILWEVWVCPARVVVTVSSLRGASDWYVSTRGRLGSCVGPCLPESGWGDCLNLQLYRSGVLDRHRIRCGLESAGTIQLTVSGVLLRHRCRFGDGGCGCGKSVS